jgi:AcrR family transcriptional regulator
MFEDKSFFLKKTPKQERSKFLYESILEAATRVFEEADYQGSTTNKIAELAGVSVGSLYQYFPNKDALVLALFERYLDHRLKDFEETYKSVKNDSVEAIIRQTIDMLVRPDLQNRRLLKILYSKGALLGMAPMVMARRKRVMEVVSLELERRKVMEGLKVENCELTAFVIVNSVLGALNATFIMDFDFEDEAFINELVLMVVGYLSIQK